MKTWYFDRAVLAVALSMCGKLMAVSSGEEYFTNTWVVELDSDLPIEEVDAIAKSQGFTNRGKILPKWNYYEFHHSRVAKRSSDSSDEHTKNLLKHAHIRTVEQQIAKVRVKRDHSEENPIELIDPMWANTWYLNRGVGSKTDFDMNVIPAWQMGYTGKGIVVAILDDGLERDHPDLEQNYDKQASSDVNGNDDDPMPRYDYTNENSHGTRCAGEVAAVANNSICSVGVAYDAKIGGIRMLDGDVTDLVESLSLSHNPHYIDIYSASWWPDDNGRTVDGPGKLAKQAFINGVEEGRNKKGSIFVWAAGDGGLHEDSCACDGYTNSIYTVSVNSASESNENPWYLEQCASTIATTYSSGTNYGQRQIVSTDLRKRCTDRHTGTSASAPLAAGLIAVMLQANPSLTWRDVQYITILSANPEPLLQSGEFRTNAVNRKYFRGAKERN